MNAAKIVDRHKTLCFIKLRTETSLSRLKNISIKIDLITFISISRRMAKIAIMELDLILKIHSLIDCPPIIISPFMKLSNYDGPKSLGLGNEK